MTAVNQCKNGACDQQGLMSTGVALKDLVAISLQDTVCGTTAVRTEKTIGSVRTLERRRAKCLRAKELEELRHRQVSLKLDAIRCPQKLTK